MKKPFIFLLLFLLLLQGAYFLTKGFHVNKILHSLPKEHSLSLAPVALSDEIDEILSQNFYYLGKGRQSYVFSSEDDRFVIKFLRTHKFADPLYERLFSWALPTTLSHLKERKERKRRCYLSYQLAQKELKEISSLIFMSLEGMEVGDKKLTLFDASGRKFNIPLQRVSFILQRKALPLDQLLEDLIRDRQDQEIEKIKRRFVALVEERGEKGIWNRDYSNSLRNMGWVEGRIIEMDLGSFHQNEPLLTKEEETERYKRVFDQFLKKERLKQHAI